ncbi:hypothetical protein ASPCAL03174 [Aspergillus calidoustus]|uniref:Uncharacterized protein n=1 Tax=Aspergillus calidoustus TaxID=454130 RepID=A0A0U5GQS0_ASPCI|nr:hypothetical protein ASPCAL03174 [Aspergillus calidoustus]
MDSSEADHIAERAEEDVNTYQAKQGIGRKSDSTLESGVDEMVERKFPQAGEVRYGRVALPTGSDRKPIPEEEGGVRDARGRLAPAKLFEGPGGPEDKVYRE